MNQALSDESLRKIVEQKVIFRYSVKVHITSFVFANIILLIINLIYHPEFLWVVMPTFGWLIGVAIHYLAYILYARGVYPMAKRAMWYIITAYIFGMLFLFLTNYITLGVINWALYPALFGGTGVIVYIFIYLIFFRSKLTNSGEKKSKIDKAVEKEMEKLMKNRNNI